MAPEKAIDSLNNLAWDFVAKDIDVFKKYGFEALKRSNDNDYLKGKCESIQTVGTFYSLTGKLDSALIMYQDALIKRTKLGDSSMISGTLNNIGNVYEKQGKYYQALEQYKKANSFIPLSNLSKKARLSGNIGAIYIRMGNYAQALSYTQEASKVLGKISPNTSPYAKCLLNEANIYDLMTNYDRALELYEKANDIFGEQNDKLNIANIHNNIGNIYLKQGDIDNAILKYQEALQGYNDIPSAPDIAGVEQNLSLGFKLKGNLKRSMLYINKSIDKWVDIDNHQKHAEALINRGDLLSSIGEYGNANESYQSAEALLPINSSLLYQLYSGLSSSYEKQKLYEKAFPYQLKCLSITDSLSKEVIRWKNLESEHRESVNKVILLEKEQKLSEEKLKKEKILRYSLLVGLILMSLLVIAWFKNWKANQRRLLAEKEALTRQQEIEKLLKDQELMSIRHVLDVQDKERKRIAQDLHDRLGSILSMAKLHFQKANNQLEELKKVNLEAYDKANALLDQACDEVREIAHNLSSGILKNFGLVPAIEELQATLINTGKYDVEFIAHRFDERISSENEIIIYRIIQELISNVIRHAKATQISIQFIKKDEHLSIHVEDNGIGFDPRNDVPLSGMGFKNIRSRLLPLNGELRIDSRVGRGTTVFIEIPLNS